jgi:hypothetical protein
MEPDFGRIAYEAYGEMSGGRSLVSGAELPGWPDLPESIQVAWTSAARAVLHADAESHRGENVPPR